MNPMKYLINYLFPLQCAFCDKTLEINAKNSVCRECAEIIKNNRKRICCSKCGKPVVSYGKRKICYFCYDNPTKYFNRIVSSFGYSGMVQTSILRYKAKGIRTRAEVYAEYMAETVREHYGNLEFEIMCAAPSHINKKREQGFDNVGLIGKHMSKMLGIPFEEDAVTKIRKTPRQTGLAIRERLVNLKNSMTADSHTISGKTVLLVDDVCTTRATIIECSRALKAAGAKGVYAVTFATTMRNPIKLFNPVKAEKRKSEMF